MAICTVKEGGSGQITIDVKGWICGLGERPDSWAPQCGPGQSTGQKWIWRIL